MKNFVAFICLLMLTSTSAFAGTIVLEGSYQEENIFVVNSIAESGVGFCVYEVLVNGEVTSDETNSQAFEIDLSIYRFKMGDNLVITIKYKDGCEPKILNAEALQPKPSFETVNIDIDREGSLVWTTKGEVGKLPFVVQQFKWNKWVDVGEVMGEGTRKENSYNFAVPLVSGANKVRVVQKTSNGEDRTTPEVKVNPRKNPVTFDYSRKSDTVTFSEETSFELYNAYGQIVKRGRSKHLDMSDMPSGEYYLSYDSSTEKFTHK